MKEKIGLHWFRKDLRLQDNPSLAALSNSVDKLICVYMLDEVKAADSLDPIDKKEQLGPHRASFIHQSLVDLDQSLQSYGQALTILKGDNLGPLLRLIDDLNITHLSAEWHCGVNEREQWRELGLQRPDLCLIQEFGSTLYQQAQFPFSIENLPATFSPFRKKVEKYCSVERLDAVFSSMPPPMLSKSLPSSIDVHSLSTTRNYYPALIGGETQALAQLRYYLWDTDLISSYKQSRNGLDGWEFSSKLSAWLAQGCISPKRVYHELLKYEENRTKNESTYWLFFELLWREFYHWHHFVHKSKTFSRSGVQGLSKPCRVDKNVIMAWCEGTSGYPIVDACMRQLKETGFMSNRGRQLVASCFVHELGQDWRYGASYFEYQLIDFDVASNWGNWQYLAGVGADPRGLRQFNLQKQTEIYDPQQSFINHWLTSNNA